jgi:hypothetical protein
MERAEVVAPFSHHGKKAFNRKVAERIHLQIVPDVLDAFFRRDVPEALLQGQPATAKHTIKSISMKMTGYSRGCT